MVIATSLALATCYQAPPAAPEQRPRSPALDRLQAVQAPERRQALERRQAPERRQALLAPERRPKLTAPPTPEPEPELEAEPGQRCALDSTARRATAWRRCIGSPC